MEGPGRHHLARNPIILHSHVLSGSDGKERGRVYRRQSVESSTSLFHLKENVGFIPLRGKRDCHPSMKKEKKKRKKKRKTYMYERFRVKECATAGRQD